MNTCKSGRHTWPTAADAAKCCNGYHREMATRFGAHAGYRWVADDTVDFSALVGKSVLFTCAPGGRFAGLTRRGRIIAVDANSSLVQVAWAAWPAWLRRIRRGLRNAAVFRMAAAHTAWVRLDGARVKLVAARNGAERHSLAPDDGGAWPARTHRSQEEEESWRPPPTPPYP